MAAAEFHRRIVSEQTASTEYLVNRVIGSEPLTTREAVTNGVAAEWLRLHPQFKVTEANLANTLQQMFTEMFKTGVQHRHDVLSDHAVSVLGLIGVGGKQAFAPARTFSKTADMPVEYGVMFGRLAEVLAPLAAAIQLTRTAVADAAAERLAVEESARADERRRLRGFVVSHVRPYAEQVHARVGANEAVDVYLRLILEELDVLASEVVAAVAVKDAQPKELSQSGSDRLDEFAREHLGQLRRDAAARYGQHAEDIVGATMLKLSKAFRNNPELSVGLPYARRALKHAAIDFFDDLAEQQAHEVCDFENVESLVSSEDATAEVGDVDVVLHWVLSTAATLVRIGGEAELAAQVLLTYFLADPSEVDPRRARLAERVLDEMRLDGEELGAIAEALVPDQEAANRVIALGIGALRAYVSEYEG
jgi:DNA-directed RNA polymerase specialized sigma24 family protein